MNLFLFSFLALKVQQRLVLRQLWRAGRRGNIQAARVYLLMSGCGCHSDGASPAQPLPAERNETASASALVNGRPELSDRQRLPNRRRSVRETMTFEFSGKTKREYDIGFGLDESGHVREVFCAGAHTQSDLQAVLEDSCIALSIALQHGARIADIAKSFGELREEGATDGPPASPLGKIARLGAEIEAEHGAAS